MHLDKIIIDLDSGEVFEKQNDTPPGNWKNIRNVTPQDWITLVYKLRWNIEDLSIENYHLKRDNYRLREGIESSNE